jgi:hypothetical protein
MTRLRAFALPAFVLALALVPLALAALILLSGCRLFDPTPPPAARLGFSLDLPAGAEAEVRVYDDNDKLVGKTRATGGGALEVELAANQDFGALRIVARSGERLLKAVVPGARRGELVELEQVWGTGTITAELTAHAQLIQEKVAGGGGSFSSVPQTAVAGLVEQIRRKNISEVRTFVELVRGLLARSRTDPALEPALFGELDAELADAFVAAPAAELPRSIATDYRNALTIAASKLEISLVCDAAQVKVMFTVDASGEALDGNGAPQLIRPPTKAGVLYLALTVDESSPVADSAGLLSPQMVPNDPGLAMFDDGTGGDEQAGDGVYTRVLVLPRGMRVKYKYTNGSAGEGWTRTEEWPGNARILEVRDLLSRQPDGPDCLVIRRDVFGDEASNKNFVNLHSQIKAGGGTLGFEKDLGGPAVSPAGEDRYLGGLDLGEVRKQPPLSPAGLAEALENGVCTRCPAPLTLNTNDREPPALVGAEFTSTTRVKVSFSEPMEYSSASLARNYLILDGASRALAVRSVAASGSTVTLEVRGPDFGQRYTLHVKGLRDASANANPLPEGSSALIGADRTPPQLVSVQPLPLRDFNPAAKDPDPTVGQVLLLTFSEELDRSSAENAQNYQIQALAGSPLAVKAAYLESADQVWLVTGAQGKRKPYGLLASNVRDLAGNAVRSTEPVKWNGFALYRVTFGAVPGFAFLDLKGQKRGLPQGSRLYLTGTILSVARDLEGNPIGVGGRTALTGIPEFEMKPTAQLYRGKPIYSITLLAPPGSYAWKVAHGIPGEHKNPPPTLEKVHKSLCTTADATGVNIDPVTLAARPRRGGHATPTCYLYYTGPSLPPTVKQPPGPFTVMAGAGLPAPTIMFKRENPDEVCVVSSGDRSCPAIVVGTWRDLPDFMVGGKTDDYDDGLPEVDPVRVQPDVQAPRLRDLRVRDSESLLLSFDERLVIEAGQLELSARHAKKGTPLEVTVEALGSIGSALLPHQVLVRTGKMENGAAYLLSYAGVADALGNALKTAREQSFVAPPAYKPFTPLADTSPPRVLGVIPKSPTSLLVQFDEKIAPADGADAGKFAILAESGSAPQVLGAALQGGGTAVLLSTGLQVQEAPYTLVVTGISDQASPPNLLVEQKVKFKGFGDSTPPAITYAAAISPTELVLAFSEPLAASAASAPQSYVIPNLTAVAAAFSGDPARKAAAFDPARATYSEDVVVLQTAKMTPGAKYTVTPSGVTDLAGNPCKESRVVTGVAAPPKVDVVFTYKVSQSDTVAGIIPPRAISPATLAAEREGIFMLGCTVSVDGMTKGAPGDPINVQMGNFPPEGQPLTGLEPQLLDNGVAPDAKAGDSIFSIRIKGVPLGTSLLWKAFASYKQGKSAFADAAPGPSVFSDGQEFPGNENAVRILGDRNGDGVVVIHNLFGAETTHKKLTNTPPFVWVVDDHAWLP